MAQYLCYLVCYWMDKMDLLIKADLPGRSIARSHKFLVYLPLEKLLDNMRDEAR